MINRGPWILDLEAGPVFTQIAHDVGRMVARGDLSPGEKLPSARDLAAKLGVNPNTIIHAFAELERLGVIETKRGLGTFVRHDAPVDAMRRDMLRAAATIFAAEVRALGVPEREALEVLREVVDAG